MPVLCLLVGVLLSQYSLANTIQINSKQTRYAIQDQNTLVIPSNDREQFLVLNNLENYYNTAEFFGG